MHFIVMDWRPVQGVPCLYYLIFKFFFYFRQMYFLKCCLSRRKKGVVLLSEISHFQTAEFVFVELKLYLNCFMCAQRLTSNQKCHFTTSSFSTKILPMTLIDVLMGSSALFHISRCLGTGARCYNSRSDLWRKLAVVHCWSV